jgi:type VI secretion system secreted protein Hcp
MAFDTYVSIKTPDVKGESTAKEHEGWIEIYSFSWGASNPTTVGPGSGGISAGRVSVSSFNLMKKTETSSPDLMYACCNGQHYGEVVVDMRKATGTSGEQKTFLKYTFNDCMVESVQWSGSTGGDDTPTESVSLAFAKCKIEYFKQDTATGVMKPSGTATWDLTTVTK